MQKSYGICTQFKCHFDPLIGPRCYHIAPGSDRNEGTTGISPSDCLVSSGQFFGSDSSEDSRFILQLNGPSLIRNKHQKLNINMILNIDRLII